MPEDAAYFDALVARTVANAAAMDFYRTRWPADAAARVRRAEDVALLPIVERGEVQAAAGRGFGDPGAHPLIHHTKGSSGSGLLYRFRTAREIGFLQRFFARAQEGAAEGPADLVLLQEADGYHGTPVPLPARGMVLQVASDRTGIDHFAEMLATEFPVSGGTVRINAFSGTPAFLFLATLNLLRLGRDPAECRLRAIATSGGFLSAWRRRFLEERWGCPVISHFSLSEIFASAVNVDGGNRFLFRPTVLVEFLDPESRAPVEPGRPGVLVLSELAPFVTAQPLIRYWTGDLVVPHDGPLRWMRAFSPLGRLAGTIRDAAGCVLVTEHALIEAIEETQGIAWTHHQPWIGAAFGRVPLDMPHVRIDAAAGTDGGALRIDVETLPSPFAAPDAAGEIAESLRTRLLARSPALAAAERRGTLRLTVAAKAAVAPGALDY